MSHALRERLGHGLMLADGAWGTLLQARGLPPGHPPDAWNLSHAADVEAVARSYVEAGSDLILTNTFGANPWRLARGGFAERLREINRDWISAGSTVIRITSDVPSAEPSHRTRLISIASLLIPSVPTSAPLCG